MKRNFSVRQMLYAAMGAVLIALCSWLTVPGPVPFTLQTFAVFTVLGLLGGKLGTISVAVYLLLGLVGAPVFAGFGAGPAVLFGATGGYLLGFLLTAGIYWLWTAGGTRKLWSKLLALLVGLLCCYAAGTVWYMAVYAGRGEAVGLWTALGWCVLPFIPFDLAKLAVSAVLIRLLGKYIKV